MNTPKESTRIDQWQSQVFARLLKHARVVYISDVPDEMVREMHMIPAHSLPEALKKTEELLHNPHADIAIIPDGIAVIVKQE
jgi:nickel-dependent lactate racemase